MIRTVNTRFTVGWWEKVVIPGSGLFPFLPGFKPFRVYSWAVSAHSWLSPLFTVLTNL